MHTADKPMRTSVCVIMCKNLHKYKYTHIYIHVYIYIYIYIYHNIASHLKIINLTVGEYGFEKKCLAKL